MIQHEVGIRSVGKTDIAKFNGIFFQIRKCQGRFRFRIVGIIQKGAHGIHLQISAVQLVEIVYDAVDKAGKSRDSAKIQGKLRYRNLSCGNGVYQIGVGDAVPQEKDESVHNAGSEISVLDFARQLCTFLYQAAAQLLKPASCMIEPHVLSERCIASRTDNIGQLFFICRR